jgi:putative restriction endonuclease
MGVTIDDQVRAAAIAMVQQLREVHAGRIPRSALNEGVVLDGRRVPIWNYQKGIFKPAAFGRDGAALSIQTSADSPYGDVHDAETGLITYKYRGGNPAHPDNRALRRALRDQRPLIYLVAVDPGVYDVITPVYVTADDPHQLQFTLMADQLATVPFGANTVETTIRREYTTRAVLQRLHQQQFRRRVLAAYREECSICRLRHLELLDAAHILPDRHPLGEPLVSNGLGLCKIHHSAYDAGIIGVDPDSRVHVREDILNEKDGPMLKHGLQEIAGARLLVPARRVHRPNREFLAVRFERFLSA